MKTIKLLTVILSIIWCLSSCSPVYYAPNSHNVPLMEEKGDLSFQGSVGLGAERIDVNASCAVSDHIGVIANYMSISVGSSNSGNGSGTSNYGNGSMFEIGAGYYTKPAKNWILETYAILGRGNFRNSFTGRSSSSGTLAGDISKYALQANFGYKMKIFEFAVSIKPSMIRYSDVIGGLRYNDNSQKEFLTQNNKYYFIERATTVRFGFDKFKLQAQIGDTEGENDRIFGESLYIAVGMHINLNAINQGE